MTKPGILPSATMSLPDDPALPTLGMIVDAERFSAGVREAIGVSPDDARPRWLRYKRGVRAVVLYEVTLTGRTTWAVVTLAADGAGAASTPDARRIAAACRGRSAVPQPVHSFAEAGALVEWYPASSDLPGLITAPERLSEVDGQESEPEMLVYRPAQRVVLRADGLYLKAYASAVRFARAVEGLTLAPRVAGLGAPALVKAFPGDRLTIQGAITGAPLEDAPDARARLGETLRRLHASAVEPSRQIGPTDHLNAGRKAAARAAALLPRLGTRISSLLERLAGTEPPASARVPSHGDFHERQALEADGRIALIDFDSMMLADPAFDFARFGAHDVSGPAAVSGAFARIDQLAGGYGGRPGALPWFLAVAILRRITHRFRRLQPDWPAQMEEILDAAGEALR